MRSALPAIFLLLLLALPSRSLAADPTPLGGIWAPAELVQALAERRPQEIPCYLVIEAEPLEVFEDCGGVRTRWAGVAIEAPRAGRLEIQAGEARRLVFRAGTPNELEFSRGSGEEIEFLRLHRLPEASEFRLRSWAAAQRMLVGSWTTEEGTPVRFEAEGTYLFANERGRYRLAPGTSIVGAWGVLRLEPEEAKERTFLLTGAGRRIGLAVPPPELQEAVAEELGDTPGAGGIAGSAVQERAPMPGALPELEEAPSEVPDDGMQVVAPELEVVIWLEREGPSQQPTMEAAPEPEPEEPGAGGAGELPPIAQPISPKGRCGCSAGEASLGAGLLALLPALWRWRRR